MQNRMKVLSIVQEALIQRFIAACLFVIGVCFDVIAEAVIANGKPNAGQEAAAIGISKAVAGLFVQSEFIPKDSLIPIFLLNEQLADIAANFGARRGEFETFEEGIELFLG